MRVISGKYRSRKLLSVEDSKTRPTTDKNRETMFNLIGPYFQGGICLDLFSGSGALGIEALSRGIDYCYFCDISNEAIKVINHNIKTLSLDKVKVFQRDYSKVVKYLKDNEIELDLVFLDPPYDKVDVNDVIKTICDYEILSDDAIIVTETAKDFEVLEHYKKLIKCKERAYGISKICVFRME